MNVQSIACPARVEAVVGPVGCGKTQQLVERVFSLVERDVPAREIAVFAATPAAAGALRDRLRARLGDGAEVPPVTTPLSWAAGLLARDAGPGGRRHVLAAVEERFLTEDLKTCGLRARRLSEMLKFLKRGWSELRDDEPDWLVTDEERGLQRYVRERLEALGACLPAEAPGACLRLLAGDPARADTCSSAWVVADDAQAMSRASQRLCALLARDGLVLGWNESAGLPGEEEYGYTAGLDELRWAAGESGGAFCTTELHQSRCSQAVAEAVRALYGQPCMVGEAAPQVRSDVATGRLAVRVADDLTREMDEVVAEVRGQLERGAAPDEVWVACPNGVWARRAAAALEKAGIACARPQAARPLDGDVRKEGGCAGARVWAALQLAADENDALAWRMWCGFGDYLAQSAAFELLYRTRRETGATLAELVRDCGDGAAFAGVAARRDELAVVLEKVRGLAGEELLEALAAGVLGAGAAVPADLRELVGPAGAQDDARELCARSRARLCGDAAVASGAGQQEGGAAAGAGDRRAGVHVGLFGDLVGQAPRTLVCCGLVNGLIPKLPYFDLAQATADEQTKMHDRLIHQLCAVAGKAHDELVCCTFTEASLQDAETAKLQVERVFVRHGERRARLAPSVCVAYLTAGTRK